MQHDFLTDLFGNTVKAKILKLLIHNHKEDFTAMELARRVNASPRATEKELQALMLHVGLEPKKDNAGQP